ncbi:MAG: DUF4388 domain-containing protein [Chitinivibrionales bacterium]
MNNSYLIICAGFLAGCAFGACLLFLHNVLKRNKIQDNEHFKTSFAFSGNLKQTPLIDAIQFLEIGRREGILHIYCGRRKGYLIFKDGHVMDAFFRNYIGKEAVFTMLDLEEGDFYFEPKIISQPRLISQSIMDLALEWDGRKTTADSPD